MSGKAKDIDKDNDLTTIIFQAFKKAEPIIILASISLAVGALVASRLDQFLVIFNNSVISSFMFIFSFVFYVIYELFKRYGLPSKKLASEEYSSGMSLYNMARFAPIYFAVVGILYLIVIAAQFGTGEFGTDSTKLQGITQPRSLPIFAIMFLYSILFLVIYQLISTIKNVIIWKNTPDRPTKNLISFLSGKLLLLSFWFVQVLVLVYQVIGLTPFHNFMDMIRYEGYIFAVYGYITITRNLYGYITEVKNKKIKFLLIIALIIVLLTAPIVIVFILQQIGVLDKHFDLWEYTTNATKNILSQFNVK
jgi:hypothetical protein